MAGGSQIIISSDGITIITPREFKVRAGQHIFKGGQKVSVNLPLLPETQQNSLTYQFVDDDDKPYAFTKYIAYYQNGHEVSGVTDKDGWTSTLYSTDPQEVKIHLEI